MTPALYETAAQDQRLVLYGTMGSPLKKIKNVRCYPVDAGDYEADVKKLFRTYSFASVVVFSATLMQKSDWAKENALLHKIFELCRVNAVARAVYVTLDVMRLTARTTGSCADYEMLLREDTARLCKFYAQSMELTVLRLPYLYDPADIRYPLRPILQAAHDSNRLYFAYGPATGIEFLSMGDFTALLVRVLDASPGGEYTVHTGAPGTLETLGDALTKEKPELTAVFNDETVGLRLPRLERAEQGSARADFGWFARENFFAELPALYAGYKPIPPRPKTLREKLLHLNTVIKNSKPLRYLAVTLLFFAFEALELATGSHADFAFIDCPLVYVTLIGTVYGLNCGMYAAVLVCLSLFASRIMQGTAPEIIFYNLENWMPFVFYLFIGAVLGYMHDNTNARIRYTEQERGVVEQKYRFIKGAYEDMLDTKSALKKQLLGAHESFGQIYEVTRRLDQDLPQDVCREALAAMENTLDNHTAAIYMVDKQCRFARLVVCSREIHDSTSRSLCLAEHTEVLAGLREGEVWANREALPGEPAYCAGIYEGDALAYLLVLYTASFAQMGMYYVNQIKVLSGLCKSALLRALRYERGIQAQRCVTGTELLKPVWFQKLLTSHVEMQKDHTARHILIRVTAEGKTLEQISALLMVNMRASDFAGMDAAGAVYVLLAQAGAADFPAIQQRYSRHAITAELVEEGELAL